jgi:hypothetical protein
MRTKVLTAIGTALALAAVGASLAQAELSERGDLFVKFDGSIEPKALPRHHRASIEVNVAGTVKTLSGEKPPALRQIVIEINRGGTLDTRGLAVCRQSQLNATSSKQALGACGKALVGTGRYDAVTAFPEQGGFPASGRILAFNARVGGRRAILAHVYGTDPVPISRVIVFRIRHGAGTFATVFSGDLPPALNRDGYVKQISLNLHRTYTFRGQKHSYLGAACAAPPGLSVAVFPFARTSMTFSDGRTLSSTLIRTCRVRD